MTTEMDYGWMSPVIETQTNLFSSDRDSILSMANVSLDEVQRWHEMGWISFGLASLETLDTPLLYEIRFIRNLARSGLSNAIINNLLSKLEKPYRYDPVRVAYNFALGWVQIPIMPSESEVEEYMHENLDKWIFKMGIRGEVGLLTDIMDHCSTEIQRIHAYRLNRIMNGYEE